MSISDQSAGPPPHGHIRVYLCHEPHDAPLASCLTDWTRTNDDVVGYNARVALDVGGAESTALRDALARAIQNTDVFVCIVSQGTVLEPWVTWEIEESQRRLPPPGLVCVKTREGDQPPQAIRDRGAIFVQFQRGQVQRAIEWAISAGRQSGDFEFQDD